MMTGTQGKFKCAKCAEEQQYRISYGDLFKLNNKWADCVIISCKYCNKLHFIDSSGLVVSEDAEKTNIAL